MVGETASEGVGYHSNPSSISGKDQLESGNRQHNGEQLFDYTRRKLTAA